MMMIIIIFSQWPDHQGRDGDTSLPLPALLKTRWQISVFIGSDDGAGVGGDRSIMVWMVMVSWLPDPIIVLIMTITIVNSLPNDQETSKVASTEAALQVYLCSKCCEGGSSMIMIMIIDII